MENLNLETRRALARARINALGTAIKVFEGHLELCKLMGLRFSGNKRIQKKKAKRMVGGMAFNLLAELMKEKPDVDQSELDLLDWRNSHGK